MIWQPKPPIKASASRSRSPTSPPLCKNFGPNPRRPVKSPPQRQCGRLPTGWRCAKKPTRRCRTATSHMKRSQLMMEYPRALLTGMLGLSPEQIAKFEDNEMRHRGETIDVRSAAADQKLSPNDPAFAGILQQQEAALLEASAKKSSGRWWLPAVARLPERDFSARAVVTNWAGAAVVAGLPLTSDQIAQLSTLVIQAARPSAAQPQAYIGNVDWNNINAQNQFVP